MMMLDQDKLSPDVDADQHSSSDHRSHLGTRWCSTYLQMITQPSTEHDGPWHSRLMSDGHCICFEAENEAWTRTASSIATARPLSEQIVCRTNHERGHSRDVQRQSPGFCSLTSRGEMLEPGQE